MPTTATCPRRRRNSSTATTGLGYGAFGTTTTGTGTGRATYAATGVGTVSRDREGAYDDSVGRPVGRDTSGPTADEAMTRSEERLRVGTETREAGRARLRKHVASEHQQATVPVSLRKVTLERAPITAANRGAAYDGRAISEEEHEVTLHAERPVVDIEAVPVERVRLGKETVADQETVGGEVRKEEVEFDTATPASATTRAADLAVGVDGSGPEAALGPGAVSSEVGWDESLADLHTLSTRQSLPAR